MRTWPALLAVLVLAGAPAPLRAETDPASLVGHSILGDPAMFLRFARDPRWIARFISSMPARPVLGSPRALKLLVSRGVIEAFVSSPAMRSRRAVAALARGPLLAQLMQCEGIRALVADPDFASALLSSPAAVRWLARNPSARRTLRKLSPSLAGALSAPAAPFANS